MKTNLLRYSLRSAVRWLPPAAGLLALTGCTHPALTRAPLELPPIVARDLPADCTAPQVIRSIAPNYPVALRREGVEEEVSLVCLVDAQGVVRQVATIGAPSHTFAESAARALYQWQFTPGRRHGEPVSMSVVVPFRFAFEESASSSPGVLRRIAADTSKPPLEK